MEIPRSNAVVHANSIFRPLTIVKHFERKNERIMLLSCRYQCKNVTNVEYAHKIAGITKQHFINCTSVFRVNGLTIIAKRCILVASAMALRLAATPNLYEVKTMKNIPGLFASAVFTDKLMREKLPKGVYYRLSKTTEGGLGNQRGQRRSIAMKDWAVEKARRISHWFSHDRHYRRKHDSFISPSGDGEIIVEFSDKALIKANRAHPLPSGGLRATFGAGLLPGTRHRRRLSRKAFVYSPLLFLQRRSA